MRIIVVGGGIYGTFIVERLCAENHDLVVVDIDSRRLDAINANLDVLTVKGSGSDINTLQQAGILQADMLIAVTSSDEVNIVACMMAKYCNVGVKIARMSKIVPDVVPENMKGFWGDVGIDFTVNPEEACAREFESLTMSSGIIEEIGFNKNKISLIGCKIGAKANVKNIPLRKINGQEILNGIRFVAIHRSGNIIIPKGDDKILDDDTVYFMCDKKMVEDVLVWLDVPNYIPERVIIDGASDVGVALAKILEEHKVDVKLIEQDPDKAADVSEILTKTMVFNGVATDESFLKTIEIPDVDAFVSVTNDDENNILSCVLSKQLLAKKTFCLIRKNEYADLVSSVMKINGVVNPRRVAINSILKFIRKGNFAEVTSLRELDAEVMEVIIDKDSKVVGKKISELKFPKDAIIGAVIVKGKVLFATGEHVIKEGNHILVLLLPSAVLKVESIFAKKLFKIF